MHMPVKAVEEGLELRLIQVEDLVKLMAARTPLDALLSPVLRFPTASTK